ncbi:16S rRNA methyltransferase [Endozoicomonas sp. (ex Bugula neritina AB1)]|nr:16S rRNA methyltransferase [Endozoicomonas sp. (ex Bugula neritina AB1)]
MSCPVFIEPSFIPENLQALTLLTEQIECQYVSHKHQPIAGSLIIGYVDGMLSVRRQGAKEKPVSVDFVGGKAGHRRKFGGGKGQDIAKAVGLNKGAKPSVIDATGGLGHDGFVLASLGCTVILIERSPIIAALLADGIRRAKGDDEVASIANRMELIPGDSKSVMEALAMDNKKSDVVYLDPMFPHRDKSALVKKEMRLFQDLLGNDLDADELLEPALKLANYRVVIKRPKGAPDLNQQEPTYRLEGKACRYDIHALKAFNP